MSRVCARATCVRRAPCQKGCEWLWSSKEYRKHCIEQEVPVCKGRPYSVTSTPHKACVGINIVLRYGTVRVRGRFDSIKHETLDTVTQTVTPETTHPPEIQRDVQRSGFSSFGVRRFC